MLLLQLAICYYLTSSVHGDVLTNCTHIVAPSGTCPNSLSIPCYTLDAYVESPSLYFQSNTTFCFTTGTHILNVKGVFEIEHISNILLIGLGNCHQKSIMDKVIEFNFNQTFPEDESITFLEPTTIIQCENSSGLVFNNITNLSFINLTIVNCGANVTDILSFIQRTSTIDGFSLVQYVAVLMINVSNLHIETTSIQNSAGYGLMGINILGQSQVTGSSFVGNNQFVKNNLQLYNQTYIYCTDGTYYTTPKFYRNNATETYAGGNVVFIYDEQALYVMEPVINISYCLFTLGVDGSLGLSKPLEQNFPNIRFRSLGTGISILLLQNSRLVHITIANTTLYRNQASYGGNLNFQVNSTSLDITITNVNSSRGISEIGGVLYFLINPLPYPALGNFKVMDSTFIADYKLANGIYIVPNGSISIQFENCLLKINVGLLSSLLSETSNPVMFRNSAFNGLGCGGGIGAYYTDIIVSNCSFIHANIYASDSDVYVADSTISNNIFNAMELENSHLSLSGNINFINNNVEGNGGGLYLSYSDITFKAPVNVTFINNSASFQGGAVFIRKQIGDGKCNIFFGDPNGTLENPGVHLYFEGNYAHEAGNVLYGGDIDICAYDCSFTPKYSHCSQYGYLITIFQATNKYLNNGNTSEMISSDPRSICSCTNTTTDCYSETGGTIVVYPGQSISIPIIIVGQLNGISPDTILTYTCDLIDSQKSQFNCTSSTSSMQPQQQTHQYCTNYQYQVKGRENRLHSSIIYFLSKTAYVDGYGTSTYSMQITVTPCPIGYIWSPPSQECICSPVLKDHGIQCDINTLKVSKSATQWIGNSSSAVLAVHPHCPYDYCSTEVTTFSLEHQDDQCNHNHSGVLCGGCQPGLSAVFGSTQCMLCTDLYLGLLIPISIMGVALVAFVFLLNCTVSVGTLNGLILYANIIRPGILDLSLTNNQHYFKKFLFVFIDWLNLDLGIAICFYDGMDTYAKTWLELLFPLYILALVGAIIVGSNWSSKLAWLCKHNAVPVLVTLTLLSYTNFLKTIVTIFSPASLDIGNSTVYNPPVWLADGNVLYVQGKHGYLFAAGLVVTIAFIIPYTFLLFLSPWLQAKSHLKLLRWVNRLKPFIDAYQAPFKDQYRYWPGVHLMVRAGLYLVKSSQ